MPDSGKKIESRILVWDLPTRIFHWLFVISFTTAWIVSENDRFLYEHVFAGYVFFGLLIFRLIWGWVGSHYALFRSFAYDWPSVTSYLKGLLSGSAQRHIGHNPAGGWAIFALLILAVLVSVTGLLTFGGEEGHGPLAGFVSYDVGNAMKEGHEIFASLMLFLVFIHVSGVIVESFFHRENLVRAMITGFKSSTDEPVKIGVYALVGIMMFFTVLGSAALYFRGYVTQTDAEPFIPFTSPPLPTNTSWETECGECHLAFHPTLLPARSWKLMMEQQHKHFDEDLDYDEETVAEILHFLITNASESGLTEAAHKIDKSVSKSNAPLRITETRYWKKKHEEIEDRYWKAKEVKSKTNCAACHLDAKTGWFEDSNMRLPKLK